MEHNIEISQSGITFLNEPKLSPHDVDQKFNERRISLVHDIKDYISTSTLFKNKQTSITFVEKGVSSLVSIIETDGKKMVLKIPLSLTNSFGEAQFLKVWEQAGVRVPHVIDEGFIGGILSTVTTCNCGKCPMGKDCGNCKDCKGDKKCEKCSAK